MKSIHHNVRNIMISAMILTTTLLFWACAADMANYGKNQYSNDARQIFENFQVLPDHNYYYIGSNIGPDAIIAVHKSYTVTSAGIWTKVEPDRKEIKFLVETLRRDFSNYPDGYHMLDPKGKRIGFYYSLWDPWPVQMEGENEVWIYPPDKKESIGLRWGK